MSEEVVEGQKELFKALDNIQKKIRNKILRTELRAGAKEMAAVLKEAAPVGDDPDSGTLKRQVKVRAGKRSQNKISMVATIQPSDPSKFYAPFVELGTKKMAAEHFGEHAGDETLPGLAKTIPERIWAAIQNEAK